MSKPEACHDCKEPTTYYLFDVPVCKKCYNYDYKRIKEPTNDFKNGYNSAVEEIMELLSSSLLCMYPATTSLSDVLRNISFKIYENHFTNQQDKEKK